MQFDSLTFIVFFALVATTYWQISNWSARKTLLLLASYVFYAAWNPLFLPLLITTSFLDWRLALYLDAAQTQRWRRFFMLAIIIVNLGVLAWFKYWNFFLDNVSWLLTTVGSNELSLRSDIALPIGISFYTFHSLSYCIDIYRGKIGAVKSPRDYFLYIAFFPQLVAGPIVRWTTIGQQIKNPRVLQPGDLGVGLTLMLIGLFEKIVLADRVFAPVANDLFSRGVSLNGVEAWVGAFSFSGQIFADFAGYTTCALGAALVLGFQLPINFKAPYAADGFSDFWKRWHISLSSWLRDYLYISLGGNRRGSLLTYRNLMLTMLLGGLWHGAAWTFVIWGAAHGALLVFERWIKQSESFDTMLSQGVGRYLYRALTLLFVAVVWVYFRADSLQTGNAMTMAMLTDWQAWPEASQRLTFESNIGVGVFFVVVAVQWMMREKTLQELVQETPAWLLGLMCGLMMAAIALMPGESNAFIYFQF